MALAFVKNYKIIFLILWNLLELHIANGEIKLEHRSTLYLPTSYSPVLSYVYNSGIVEQTAVDDNGYYLYAVGENLLQVIDFSDHQNPTVVHHFHISEVHGEGTLNDVEVCQELVAVAYHSSLSPLNGRVIVYNKYNEHEETKMEKLHDFIVGAVPDSLKFTSDCGRIIVAIEGEVVNNNGTIVDPEGGVSLIELNGGGVESQVTFLDFTSFNARENEYVKMGVRKVYNGQGTDDIDRTTFSQDLEPENIAINEDDNLVYIPLQENNAMAVLDLETKSFVDIYPLGLKDYSSGENKLDSSDKDGGTFIYNWGDGVHGLYGMYQPDGILYVKFEGKKYIITANEGDVKKYEIDNGMDSDWQESMNGRDIVEDGLLNVNVSDEFIALLNDDSKLGRLEISIVDSLDSSGKLTKLITYGGRSISAFRANDMTLAFDSQNWIEEAVSRKYPSVFNSNCRNEEELPNESFDSASRKRGPEPEAMEYGMVNGKHVIFLGLEAPGMIIVYTLVPGTDLELQFENIYYGGGMSDTWVNMWNDRTARDLEPEDIRFIPASKSASMSDMLIVTGTVSGTISFYDVIDTSFETSSSTVITLEAYMVMFNILLLSMWSVY